MSLSKQRDRYRQWWKYWLEHRPWWPLVDEAIREEVKAQLTRELKGLVPPLTDPWPAPRPQRPPKTTWQVVAEHLQEQIAILQKRMTAMEAEHALEKAQEEVEDER